MSQYRLTQAAEADFIHILRASKQDFGLEAARRYKALISLALKDISENPALTGMRPFEQNVQLYHLRHSAKRATLENNKVKRPRHFIAYKHDALTNVIDIIRILHDAMDLEQHISQD